MEKKISFGFSKLTKKPQLVVPVTVPKDEDAAKIEFIECLEEQSIKISGKVEEQPEAPLVIALTANTTPLEKVKQLREENRPQSSSSSSKKHESNGREGSAPEPPPSDETLEQRAAREIIENLKASEEEAEATDNFTVPLRPDEVKLGGAKGSSMDDYENVPIAQFGLAMLRGMGWKDEDNPEKKNKKKGFEDDIIVCRPKGLGLGADKAMKQQVKLAANSAGEGDSKLVMKKGAYVRILAGKHKDFYGQVEGLDEESGRVFIKMALGGKRESVNEAFVQLVTEKDYKENRKVLNVSKYEEYKQKENGGGEGSGAKDRQSESSRRSEKQRDDDRDYSEDRHRDSERDPHYSDKRRGNKRDDYKDKERERERDRSHKSDRRRDRSSSEDNRRDKYSQHSSRDSGSRSARYDDEDRRSHHRDKRRERSLSRDRESSSRKHGDNRRNESSSSRRDRDSHKSKRDRDHHRRDRDY